MKANTFAMPGDTFYPMYEADSKVSADNKIIHFIHKYNKRFSDLYDKLGIKSGTPENILK